MNTLVHVNVLNVCIFVVRFYNEVAQLAGGRHISHINFYCMLCVAHAVIYLPCIAHYYLIIFKRIVSGSGDSLICFYVGSDIEVCKSTRTATSSSTHDVYRFKTKSTQRRALLLDVEVPVKPLPSSSLGGAAL